MTLEPINIIEICVAIDLAIFSLAYPIILDKTSRIGEKYNSYYLAKVFQREWSVKKLNVGFARISPVSLLMYAILFSFIFLIIPFEPLEGWKNTFLINSANWIVLLLSLFFISIFFIWLNKVILFNGDTTPLLKYLINKFSQSKDTVYLEAINEISIDAVKRQDHHIEETMVRFYNDIFYTFRCDNGAGPIRYPAEFYNIVYNLNREFSFQDRIDMDGLHEEVKSLTWVLGPSLGEHTVLSDVTYNQIWHNIVFLVERGESIIPYWSRAAQLYTFQLQHIHKDVDYSSEPEVVKNKMEYELRKMERSKHIDFHYIIGGLLLYREKYQMLKKAINYTSSMPADYVLLPSNLTDIFEAFIRFASKSSSVNNYENYYPYPDLNGFIESEEVNLWNTRYFAFLIIRQFIVPHRFNHVPDITSPILPIELKDLLVWNNYLPYLKQQLDIVWNNEKLLETVGYSRDDELKDSIDNVLDTLIENAKERIRELRVGDDLDQEAISKYREKTKELMAAGFKDFNKIINPLKPNQIDNIKPVLKGQYTELSRSAFTSGDIPHMNFDTIFGQMYVHHALRPSICGAFRMKATGRYLIASDTIVATIKKLDLDLEKHVIVVVNNINILEKINNEFREMIIEIGSVRHYLNLMFILERQDLPYFDYQTREGSEDNLIDADRHIYAGVEELAEQEVNGELAENVKVKAFIDFETHILWKKDAKLIQINVAVPFEESGIPTDVNDIPKF